jgi:hypothetical protein
MQQHGQHVELDSGSAFSTATSVAVDEAEHGATDRNDCPPQRMRSIAISPIDALRRRPAPSRRECSHTLRALAPSLRGVVHEPSTRLSP